MRETGMEAASSARPVVPWNRRLDGRVALCLALLFLVVYGLTASYTAVQNNDTRATAMAAWSLGTRGTFALPDAWEEAYVPWSVRGVDGELYVNRFPGPIVWAAPFYSLTEPFRSGAEVPENMHLIDYRPAGVAAAVLAVLALLVTYRAFREVTDRPLAIGGVLVLGLGTSVWSISADAMWTHGLTHLALAAGMYFLATERYARSGIALGIGILARPQTLVVPAVMGLVETVRRRQPGPALRVGLTSVIGLVLLMAYSRHYFGTWLPIAGYSDRTVQSLASTTGSTSLSRFVRTFVDPVRGLFVYAPFLIPLLAGVRGAWRVAPPWVRVSAVSGLVYLLVQLRANDFSGGQFFFGYRLPLEMLVLAAPLLLLCYSEWVRPRRLMRWMVMVLIALAVVLQLAGATRLAASEYMRRYIEPEVHAVCESSEQPCDPERILGGRG